MAGASTGIAAGQRHVLVRSAGLVNDRSLSYGLDVIDRSGPRIGTVEISNFDQL